MTSPEGAPVVAIIVGYIGPMAEGERLVAPVRKFGSPMVDTIGPMSYVQLNTLLDAGVPYGGVQRYWKSSFLKHLGDDVLDILVAGPPFPPRCPWWGFPCPRRRYSGEAARDRLWAPR